MTTESDISAQRTSTDGDTLELWQAQIPKGGWIHISLAVTAIGGSGSASFRIDEVVRALPGGTSRDSDADVPGAVVEGETWQLEFVLEDGVAERPLATDDDVRTRSWSPPKARLTARAGPRSGEVQWLVRGTVTRSGLLGPVADSPPS